MRSVEVVHRKYFTVKHESTLRTVLYLHPYRLLLIDALGLHRLVPLLVDLQQLSWVFVHIAVSKHLDLLRINLHRIVPALQAKLLHAQRPSCLNRDPLLQTAFLAEYVLNFSRVVQSPDGVNAVLPKSACCHRTDCLWEFCNGVHLISAKLYLSHWRILGQFPS